MYEIFTWLTISLTVVILLCDIIALGICSYVNYSNMKSKQIGVDKFIIRAFSFVVMSVFLFVCVYVLYVTTTTINSPYIFNFIEYYYSVYIVIFISIILFFGLFNYYKFNRSFIRL